MIGTAAILLVAVHASLFATSLDMGDGTTWSARNPRVSHALRVQGRETWQPSVLAFKDSQGTRCDDSGSVWIGWLHGWFYSQKWQPGGVLMSIWMCPKMGVPQ